MIWVRVSSLSVKLPFALVPVYVVKLPLVDWV